jgi:transcriptional regulator with XRE-family HTH domain
MAETAKLRRAELGLTQEQLIERMPEDRRIGVETLRRVEAGDQEGYRPGTLTLLSIALEQEPRWLWDIAHGAASPELAKRVDDLDVRLSHLEESVDSLLGQVKRRAR